MLERRSSEKMKTYKTIYADPPWHESGAGRITRGANKHYPLMPTDEIIKMKDFISTLANPEGCHLYLWVTNNFLEDGLRVMKEWGFTYKTKITWIKDRMGLGQYFRGITEDCLFGVKGKVPYKLDKHEKKTIFGDTITHEYRLQGITCFQSPKGEHSSKPEFMRKLIEKVSYPPYIELFSRKTIENWDTWGDSVKPTLC
jgi:N6-adenosine-specific RNA methylase IME4